MEPLSGVIDLRDDGAGSLVPSWMQRERVSKAASFTREQLPGTLPPWRRLRPLELFQIYFYTPDLRAVVDYIVRQVASRPWMLTINASPDDPRFDAYLMEAAVLAEWLEQPNDDGEIWQEVWIKTLVDMLIYDAGAQELAYSDRGALQELLARPGWEFTPVFGEQDRLQGYVQMTAEGQQIPLRRDQVVMYRLFPNTRDPYGGTPLIETVVNEAVSLILQSQTLTNLLDGNELPQGILVLSGLAGAALKRAQESLKSMKGQPGRLRVLSSPQGNVKAEWVRLQRDAEEVVKMELTRELRRAIWRVFGVSKVDMGDTDAVPRASAEVLSEGTQSTLMAPIENLMEEKVNRRILFARFRQRPELRRVITFTMLDERNLSETERLTRAQRHELEIKRGVSSVDEVRAELGREEVDGGDTHRHDLPGGPVPLSSLEGPASPAPKKGVPGGPGTTKERGSLQPLHQRVIHVTYRGRDGRVRFLA